MIDGHAEDLRASGPHDLASALIVRILEQHAIAFIEQHIGGERERLLRAADDEHILGRGNDAATARKIVTDLFAQYQQALRIGIVGLRMSRGAAELAAPRARELRVRHRHAVLQVVAQALMLASRNALVVERSHAFAATGERRARGLPRRNRLRRGRVRGDVHRCELRDVAARADASLYEAFRGELLVGREHGVARQVELAREHACCGQARARRRPTSENGLLERACQLRVARPLAVQFEIHDGSCDWSCGSRPEWR